MVDHIHNVFVHGHCAKIENEHDVVSITPKGSRLLVTGRPSTDNWLHYAIPSPVIVDERRLRPDVVWLRHRTTGDAQVSAVHVWDGDTRIATVDNPTGTIDSGWTRVKVGCSAEEALAVYWGLGVSIGLHFGPGGGEIEVATVGCDFDYANRVCSQRFPIRTDKRKTLEFPYRSNRPIDVPSTAIRRILISLHGTGGNGDLYLDNGMAAVNAAGGSVPDETLIIAPQFIYPREYYRTSDYYRTHIAVNDFPADLLYWRGGRAYASQSVERDLNGDGTPDSGTTSSYAALDTLLERVSKPTLFPNLQRIVIAGQSNGGQFVARYAATSPFEDEVANRRGIQVRYVAMSSGSYLYLNDKRVVAGTTNSFATPAAGCPGFNDWPWGLRDLTEYPARVGARHIRDQFRGRDVRYLQGALDTAPHTDDCEPALQGCSTVQKGEIYFNYLQDYYGTTVHQRRVVPGVGHNGHDLMTSADGLAILFGP